MADVISIRDALLSIKYDATEMLATLKKLDRLQGTMANIGGGNPYKLARTVPKSVLDPELTDSGFAEAVNRAVRKADPLSRELGYVVVVEHLVKGCEDIRRKQIKLESRVDLDPGTEAEFSAAKELSVRMKESLNAMRGKLSIALDGMLDARVNALKAIVQMDERIAKLFPDGDIDLRTSALSHSGADAITVLAGNDAFFRRGEHHEGRKRVKT